MSLSWLLVLALPDVGVVFFPPGGAVATMLQRHLTQETCMHVDFVSKVKDFFLHVGVGVGVVHSMEALARRHVA